MKTPYGLGERGRTDEVAPGFADGRAACQHHAAHKLIVKMIRRQLHAFGTAPHGGETEGTANQHGVRAEGLRPFKDAAGKASRMPPSIKTAMRPLTCAAMAGRTSMVPGV